MGTEEMTKALRYRWLIFWVLALGYVLVYFHRLCFAVVAVEMMKDLKASGAVMGFLSSAYFYIYAVMQLPAGLLSDSWGPRKTITLFFGVAFVGSMLLGLAPSLALAIVGRALVGLGVSMLFVPTMKVLAEWFRVKEFASMTGILVAMGGVGSLSATTPLAMLSAAKGWRFSFLVVGAATLVLAALCWLFVRDRPADKGWPSPSGEARTSLPAIGLWAGMKKVLGYGPFWPLAIWFFFECAIFFAIVGLWGGPFLEHIYKLPKSEAGHILAMPALGMIAGSPLLSLLSNRVFKARKPLLILASACSLGIVAVLAFFPDRLALPGLYALFFGMGVFTNAIVVIAFTATKELFPVQIAGTATGLVNLFPFLGGALLQPLMGHLLERQGKTAAGAFTLEGYRQAFLALFICGIIAFAASLFLKETLDKE